MTSLGPSTEARFADIFAATALATARQACALLGLDAQTLRDLTGRGIIRACPRGRRDAYSEAELRRFLIEPKAKEEITWRSTGPKSHPSGTSTSKSQVVGFMAARAKRAAQKQQSTKRS